MRIFTKENRCFSTVKRIVRDLRVKKCFFPDYRRLREPDHFAGRQYGNGRTEWVGGGCTKPQKEKGKPRNRRVPHVYVCVCVWGLI